MINKVERIIKERDIVIPSLLFYNYKELNIDAEEVLLLAYLINGDMTFNPKKISEDLSMELPYLMELINKLTNSNLLSIELKKINNVRIELINLDGLYDKLLGLVMVEDKQDDNNIYDIFEKEFGRTLSPMEYEIINTWQENGLAKDTIILALKEAVYNGVNNLRYIDRILSEWSKKGIKTAKDLEKEKIEFSKKRTQTIKKDESTDYDWLNEE